MLTRIRPLLTPPRFEDPTTDRQARLLILFVGAGWLASVVMGLGYDASAFFLQTRWLLLGVFWVGLGAIWLLMQRGQVRAASLFFLLAAFLLINERIWYAYGGIVSPFIAMLLLLVVVAGYLLGTVGGYLFAVLGMLAIVILYSLSSTQHPELAASGELEQLLVLWSLMLMFAALIQHSLARSLERTEAEAARRLEEVEKANATLQEMRANLERRVQERTAQNERHSLYYQRLVEHIPLAVVTLDENHCMVSWNPAFERMFGLERAALAGKDLDDVVTNPATLDEARQLTRQVKAGKPIHTQGVRYRSDGSPLNVEMFGVPVAVEGRPDGILAIYNDITSRVSSERARQLSDLRFRQTVLHSPNPIFTVDTQGVIQTWNPACVRAFQREYDILGRSYTELVTNPARQEALAMLVRDVLEGSIHQGVDIYYDCADGSTRHMISRIYPLFGEDNQIAGCVFANTDFTERDFMLDALRESELRLRGMLEQARDGVAMVDENGVISSWNPAMETITGYAAPEMVGMHLREAMLMLAASEQQEAHIREYMAETWGEFLAKEAPAWSGQISEHEILRPDGRRLTLQSVVFPIVLKHGVIGGVFSRDVTEKAHTAGQLQEFYNSIAAVMDSLGVGVYCSDMETGEILLTNRYLQQIYGSPLPGERCFERFFQRSTACPHCNNPKLLGEDGEPTPGLVWEDFNPAVQRWYLYSGRAIQWHDGRLVRLEVAVDITDRKESEQRLEFMATHDTLTRLPNRALFADRLQHAVAAASRSGEKVAVVFLDIDKFKQVNDTCGHLAGDAVLVEVAHRLRASLRAADTIARSGGDEFTLILENIEQAGDVGVTLDRILQSMARPFEMEDHKFTLTVSMGVCLYPDDSLTLDGLLVAADSAMYQAKRSGKNQSWYNSLDNGAGQGREQSQPADEGRS